MKKNKKINSTKNRYVVTWGEMGTQEILDIQTGKSFYGDASSIINQLIKELNRINNEQKQKSRP